MNFQQTKIHGFRHNIDTEVNADDTAISLKERDSGNKVPRLQSTDISKDREHGSEQKLLLVYEVQQNRVGEVSQGLYNYTFVHSNACVVTLNLEAWNELKISVQPQNNVHEASTALTGVEGQNSRTS